MAREAAERQRQRAEARQRGDEAVAGGVEKAASQDGPAAGEAEESRPYRPGEDAPWFVTPGVDAGKLGPAAEAVVLEQHGWSKGEVMVEVAGKATGQKATITFKGPAAAVLATVKKDASIWVRFVGGEIAAYHVPGAKAQGRKAG